MDQLKKEQFDVDRRKTVQSFLLFALCAEAFCSFTAQLRPEVSAA